MKIAFVQTAHLPSDERIARHQIPALEARGHETFILSTRTDLSEKHIKSFNDSAMSRRKRTEQTCSILAEIRPDLIICDTPMAVLMAAKYRRKERCCKIIYDITEWYPSKKNLRNHSLFCQFLRLLLLPWLNLFAGISANGFIFGEYYKMLPFEFFFPKKKSISLSYYPDLKYIKNNPPSEISKRCRVLYCGPLTEEKGFYNVIRAMHHAAAWHSSTHFVLTILTATPPQNPKRPDSQPENLDLHYSSYLPFEEFCEEISKHDICLDLREIDIENTHCLPIKLFYYMAAARPTLVTALKAVSQGVPELETCGVAIERPTRAPEVAAALLEYVKNPNLYHEHCAKARALSEQKYNWSLIVDDFIQMVESYEKR